MAKREKTPIPPFRLWNNICFIGSEAVSVHLIDTGAGLILIDTGYPYMRDTIVSNMRALGYEPADIRILLHSHGHYDHSYTEHFTLVEGPESPFKVKEIASFHDDQHGALRCENTIRSFTAEGVNVVHLGDLGHQLSAKQVEKIGKCDVLLLPIGGTYTLDPMEAKAVVYALQPTVVIPMHYRKGEIGFEVLRTVDEFTDLFPPSLVKNYPVGTLPVDQDTPAQIAVLRV